MLHHSGCNAMRFVVVGDVMVAISIGLGVSVLRLRLLSVRLAVAAPKRCNWMRTLLLTCIGFAVTETSADAIIPSSCEETDKSFWS